MDLNQRFAPLFVLPADLAHVANWAFEADPLELAHTDVLDESKCVCFCIQSSPTLNAKERLDDDVLIVTSTSISGQQTQSPTD